MGLPVLGAGAGAVLLPPLHLLGRRQREADLLGREECQWEGEKHKIPTTGTWIEHPYKPIIADAWLPDPSKFADPADPAYDAYWTGEGNEKGAKSNPKGLPKDPELWPTACRSSSPMAR